MHRNSRTLCAWGLAWVGVLMVASLATAEEVSPLTCLIARAPNRLAQPLIDDKLPPLECWVGAKEWFRVPVGPPEAELAVSVIEPIGQWPPKGTVMCVHGIFGRGLFVGRIARSLADAGYRTVMVDLRGHGRSTGQWLGYGEQEARDLVQVIDELDRRGLVTGNLGVYGISYGATTTIHLAALDPRVKTAVAVAPFSSIRDEIPHFAGVLGMPIGLAIPDHVYQSAIDEAGRLGHFDPDSSTAIGAMAAVDKPILLLHGKVDWLVPHYHSERLHEAASRSDFVSLRGLGHATIWIDPLGEVERQTRAWFDERL